MIYLVVSLIAGLYFLISGKVKYKETVYLEGTKARIAGLIFLAPVGLMLLLYIIVFVIAILGIDFSETSSDLINRYASIYVRDGFLIGLAYINFHSVSRETHDRGGCLSYWLMYATVIALGLIWFMRQMISDFPGYRLAIIGFVVFQMITILGIWLWKKWGIWGYAVAILVQPVINYLYTASIVQAFGSLITSLSTILILYLLVKPKWQFFE